MHSPHNTSDDVNTLELLSTYPYILVHPLSACKLHNQ